MNKKPKSVVAQAKSWAKANDLHGPHAFSRYIMLRFAESLSKVSPDFIFKGGNLLWIYIKTPRHTVDLDYAMQSSPTKEEVMSSLEEACTLDSEIVFKVRSCDEVPLNNPSAFSVSITYETISGASNHFSIDIVYGLQTEWTSVSSPLTQDVAMKSATLENIIADKISAINRFGGGNTRMKDYDDLWRIKQSLLKIDWAVVSKRLDQLNLGKAIRIDWANQATSIAWTKHSKRYRDIPQDLKQVLVELKQWVDEKFIS